MGQAIQSALSQTWPNKEVIVVDDGSTDGSRAVIQSFGDKVRYEFGPNRGGNPCRNRLLELASGEWVQFLDADDYLLPDKISKQLEMGSGTDAIYGPIIMRAERPGLSSMEECNPELGADLYERWIRWQVCQTGGVLWRRESLFAIGGWNESFNCCQDNEVCLRAIKAGLKISYCPELGAVYRIWSEDTVCRKSPQNVIKVKTVLINEMLEWLKGNGLLTEKHTKAAGQASFEMARTLAKFSILEASQYAKSQKAKGLWHPTGSAAQRYFLITMRLAGFTMAEFIAKTIRKA